MIATPRIGLTWSSGSRGLNRYQEAITAAGGRPILITPQTGAAGARDIDGLVLAGGPDVHPERYGQAIDPRAASSLEVVVERDALELDLIREALDRQIPVLGICRGIQVLNVALGGTLVQDLALAGVDPRGHDQSGRLEDWQAAHQVQVKPGSRLHRILRKTQVPVNSFHHQAVDRPAAGTVVVARAPDGVIEALEASGHQFVLGVQWHPERMWDRDAEQAALFRALIAAAGGLVDPA
ncbi:MAG: gamma-glutamyl-gamma-aminobutyrate hydrolase family protein [Armatimonadota bacterium]|nr:gamma-glutamyl-gamma-aminobutyrate hydrolase family protein [Armatimonadota bacterium]MDR7426669.1 gamma-glutamyl-gamma-aminobutyrate hydrolase family protein [Armatimonadota bacterium]MDR7464376.1 gamma-glutamyl-gamma-aminobutyrate hydrolase family protein [Armatimonadota bacterium]MDR7469220.1 gamma-glutamyl-gamma-aminobutyrate hydrolase family protein [Armatimonadota bacterium]